MLYNVDMGSITGIISGVFVSITGATDGNLTMADALQVGKVIYAVEQKHSAGTWDESWHEESHQIVKDTLRRIQYEQ
tara:strand:+ start:2718 stop:2948 length:231 start_codon:yes stop_codon:yes gene_type:complete